MASFHGLRPSDLSRFLHISLRDVRYLVSEEALHQVFDAYGATKVQMCADMTAVVSFPSRSQATRAGLDMQGRCIYTNCCWMQIQYAPAELVAPATGAVARESPPPASTPAAAPQSASISAASAGATPALVCVRASPASSQSALTAADEETPASAPGACPSILKCLGGNAPPAGTVLGFDDAELVIAAQQPDDSLKHFPVSWFFFVPVRGATATAAGIQVTSLFLSAEDVPTIVRPITVSTVLFLLLYDVRPLPWPSFLDSHHVGDQILLMPCSLFTCSPGGTCQEHPMPPPQIISLIGRSCSDLISVETSLSCLQCVHLQLCCPPGQATLSGKLFLSTKGAQVDKKFLTSPIHYGFETIQWEIAWVLQYEYDFLAEPDRLQIDCLQLCNFAVLQRLYSFSELSDCCQPCTSWQLQFFIPAPRIAFPIYDLLISLKARDELDLRPDLSLQPDIFALGCCSIVLQTMSICSSLPIPQFPWFLASCIQPGAPIFIGSDCYLLFALIYMQQWPVWEACFSFPKLQYYTEFGSTTWADQNKYRSEDYMESIKGTCFWFSTVGNASVYGSSRFQWYIAWSNTLPQAAVRTIHLARPMFILITAETLASNPGMQFLLGGAKVHYSAIFQLEIAWELEFECFHESSQLRQSLTGVSELLDIIYAGINTIQNPWDPGVALLLLSVKAILKVSMMLGPNGYVGRTTLYAAEESEWKIAWLLNLKTTTRRYTVDIPSSLETSNFTLCLSLIIPWDPGNASSIRDM